MPPSKSARKSSHSPLPPNHSVPPNARRRPAGRACESCHRSKRRCSSTYPCQYCNATGKECRFFDALGVDITSTMKQEPTDLAAPTVYPVPSHTNGHNSAFSFVTRHISINADLCSELINVFFARVHPHSTMFHQTTFVNALSCGHVPIYLVNSILALSSLHLHDRDPGIRSEVRAAGSNFARAAIHALLDPDKGGVDVARFRGQELEIAQALCCLGVFHALARSAVPDAAFSYSHQAMDILIPLDVSPQEMSLVLTQWSIGTTAALIRRECYWRTLWVIQWDILMTNATSLDAKEPTYLHPDVPLPCNDKALEISAAEQELYGTGTTSRSKSPQSNLSGFTHVIEITRIYKSTMTHLAERSESARKQLLKRGFTTTTPSWTSEYNHLRNELKLWNDSLPGQFQYMDANIDRYAEDAKSSSSNHGSDAWSFTMMHCLHSCSFLTLHAALEMDEDEHLTRLRSPDRDRAYDAILLLLGRMRTFVQTSAMALFVLAHIGGHGPQTDRASGIDALNSTLVQGLLKNFENSWDIAGREIVSVDCRTKLAEKMFGGRR